MQEQGWRPELRYFQRSQAFNPFAKRASCHAANYRSTSFTSLRGITNTLNTWGCRIGILFLVRITASIFLRTGLKPLAAIHSLTRRTESRKLFLS